MVRCSVHPPLSTFSRWQETGRPENARLQQSVDLLFHMRTSKGKHDFQIEGAGKEALQSNWKWKAGSKHAAEFVKLLQSEDYPPNIFPYKHNNIIYSVERVCRRGIQPAISEVKTSAKATILRKSDRKS